MATSTLPNRGQAPLGRAASWAPGKSICLDGGPVQGRQAQHGAANTGRRGIDVSADTDTFPVISRMGL